MDKQLKETVLKQLSTGKTKALPGNVLAQRLGFKGTRQVRLAMVELVEEGIPIVFSNKGYFIADNIEEINEARAKLRNYGKMIFRHYTLLRRASRKFTGQMTMKL